jgi:hypothetical protein
MISVPPLAVIKIKGPKGYMEILVRDNSNLSEIVD